MSVLHPQDRLPLLDLLRPPEGYHLDEAVGTTYSLDLIAMLVLPIGFTWMELDGTGSDAPTKEPLKVLEAMRSMRDRLTIFCQAGRIKSPTRHPRLVALLEDSLIEASTPKAHGSFHPKTWALRFVGEKKDDVRYRLLTLSRNITFDRCWDTGVAVEGACRLDLVRGRSTTRPLREFYSRLGDCAVKPLSTLHRRRLERFASELHRTDFEPPAPFDEVAFHSIGLDDRQWVPLDRDIDRIFVVSPFVDAGFLKHLRTSIGSPTSLERLISRPETLDELGPTALAELNIGVLDQVPDPPPPSDGEDEVEEAQPTQPDPDDSGLHAKLYLIEKGRQAALLTGSANATARAFERNVEFLIELSGRKDKVGIDAILTGGDGSLALGKLLHGYQLQPLPESTAATRAAERTLDEWCQQVASLRWHIDVTPLATRGFGLDVRADGAKRPHEPSGVTTRVVPIGASRGDAVLLSAAAAGATFTVAGLTEVSSLLLVHASLAMPEVTVERSFTTVADLHNAPTGRLDQLVSSEISRSGGLVEWLYLMLGQEPPVTTDGGAGAPGAGGATARQGRRVDPAGLFEVLVREAAEGGTRLADARRALDGLNALDTADPMAPKIRALLEQLVGGLDDPT